MKIRIARYLSLATVATIGLGFAKTAQAIVVVAPVIFYFQLAFLGIGAYHRMHSKPLTELDSFIYYTRVDEVNAFVYFQQRGDFGRGFGVSTSMAEGLQQLRLKLKDAAISSGKMTEAEFDAQYGTDQAPNYCAISKDFIVAQLALHLGGEPADYSPEKHSRCRP